MPARGCPVVRSRRSTGSAVGRSSRPRRRRDPSRGSSRRPGVANNDLGSLAEEGQAGAGRGMPWVRSPGRATGPARWLRAPDRIVGGEPVIGPMNLGTLVVGPREHVVAVSDLTTPPWRNSALCCATRPAPGTVPLRERACRKCGTVSHRVHSRYRRTLTRRLSGAGEHAAGQEDQRRADRAEAAITLRRASPSPRRYQRRRRGQGPG
jgi:hypothetical protein